MAVDAFARVIEGLRDRLTAGAPPATPPAIEDAAAPAVNPRHELQAAVEELYVAKEELAAARLEAEAQRQRYQDLFEFAPDAYLVTDAAGVVQEANRAAFALLNTRAKALIGKPLVLYVASEDRLAFHNRIAEADCGARAEVWEMQLQPREQSPLTASVTLAAVRGADGKPVALRWLIRDVTTHKQAERLAVIGQMMTGLAHESRNALQRSQACLERLNWQFQDRPEACHLLARAQQAQNDLVHLFEDVREYAAPLRLDLRPCDLREVWREAWARLSSPRGGRDARLGEIMETDPLVTADASRLGQVFRNVFENSLAACADPVRIAIRCSAASLVEAPAVGVVVRDNGPGLNAEQRRRIFDPFFSTKSRGTGLGMAIARQIVEAHGGRIVVGESPPPGAEILFALPRRQP